jgi:hypothetical protein
VRRLGLSSFWWCPAQDRYRVDHARYEQTVLSFLARTIG